jgi:hypothetical protein
MPPKKQTTTGKAAASGAARKTTRKPASRTTRRTPRPDVTHDAIARRAYELYVAESGGSPFEHWLRAERELVTA